MKSSYGPALDFPALGTYDSSRDGVLKTEWASHRCDPLPHFESIRVTQPRHRKIAVHVDFDYGQIGFLIPTNDLGHELPVIV